MVSDDARAIREVIENWALWRDAGDWARFATVWHDDGWMTATWFQGPASRFIEVTREGFNRGGGAFTFTEVAEAQRAVLDARARKVELLRSFHLDGARLDRLTGRHAALARAETR